ncbi:MAG: UvrD-helicase domain-containing protein [Bacteroidia bacterium]
MPETSSFTVYRASAGSGKTHTLVKEYLRLALGEKENSMLFRQILAITFTNKAAAEMKERVISCLHDLGKDGNRHSMKEDLCSSLNIDEKELSARCRNCLSAILHHYSDFSIGTIDSFMHRVVKSFAYDLKLPINFQVEIDADVLLNQAIDKVLNKAGSDKQLTKALKIFAEKKTDSDKFMRIEKDLFDLSLDLLRENSADSIKKLQHLDINDFTSIKNQIQSEAAEFANQISTLAKSAYSKIKDAGLEINDFYQSSRGVGDFFHKNRDFKTGDFLKLNSYVLKAYDLNLWYGNKVSSEIASKIDQIADELNQILRKLIQLKTDSYPDYLINLEMLDQIDAIAILNEISRSIDEIRNEEQTMHISEFNRRVADVVLKEPAPFVFERLGEKYRHFLIDEFQDTSVLQWQNILPLIHDGLSSNFTSIIVGDPKQAIYRFRGGEVEQFTSLPQPYPETINEIQKERYSQLNSMYSLKNLETNRRSTETIVTFNNLFYRHLSDKYLPDHLQRVYDENSQKFLPEKTGGTLGIKTLDFSTNPNKEQKNELIFSEIYDLIKKIISEGRFSYSEIAVLLRDNKSSSQLASYLIDNEIPVISGESLLVKYAPEVRMIVCWMHIVTQTEVSVYLFEILELLFESDKNYFSSRNALIEEFNQHPNNPEFWINKFDLGIDLNKLKTLPVTEFCYEICRCLEYSVQSNPYLQFFLEMVWHSAKTESADISVFLEIWYEKADKLSISIPEDANGVRLLTIHKSKGLQFPVVILSAFESSRSGMGSVWLEDKQILPQELNSFKFNLNKKMSESRIAHLVDAEQERTMLDRINLLYVATTRPENSLYILTSKVEPDELEKKENPGWDIMINDFIYKTDWSIDSVTGFHIVSGKVNQDTSKPKNRLNIRTSINYHSGEWKNKIRITRNKSLEFELSKPNEAIEEGKLVHQFLSLVNSVQNIEPALSSLTAQGLINKNEEKLLRQYARKLFDLPEIDSLFKQNDQIINEHEFMSETGRLLRPDKVIQLKNEIVVLDFKTGSERKSDFLQVTNYINSLSNLYNMPARGILIYLRNDPEIRHVSA